jgi:hypothetical protein
MGRARATSRRILAAGLLAGVLVALWASSAAAVPPPRLTGSITGSAKRDSPITFRLTATVPGGFQNVATLQIALLLHSAILDEIDYDQTRNAISTPASLAVPVGSRFSATGLFLKVSGRDVALSTSGNRLSLTVDARMVEDAPPGSQFSMAAIDDLNQVTRISRSVRLPPPPKPGFSWGTLGTAVAAALFLGGFGGNLLASRKAAAKPKVDVYVALAKQLRKQPVKT